MGIPLNQKKDVFLDSHVRFFEMVGGVYREVVYDNMKNVVTRFIGRNEKEPYCRRKDQFVAVSAEAGIGRNQRAYSEFLQLRLCG